MTTKQVKIHDKLTFFALEAWRYKIAFGGRGGMKSWAAAQSLILLAIDRKIRVLCARELQKSIKDSVHKLLKDQIELLGVGHRFNVTNNSITGTNGTEFLFHGLRANASEIKSIEGIDICWVEEAQSVSADSFKILKPTIRKENSEIWLTFNPDLEEDPAYQMVVTPPPNSKIVKIGWEDNEWLPDVLKLEKDHLYRVDPDAAANVWGGECRKYSEAQILLGKWSVDVFEPLPSWDGPYQGADWGFANDPTALVRCWIHETPVKAEVNQLQPPPRRVLYIEREVYGVGVEVVDTPAFFDAMLNARQYVTRADNARPETISHMKNNGYGKVMAAEKGAGSVEDGIMHLRSFDKIVIHQRCTHTIQEAKLYCWKTDKADNILPVPADKHNHVIDALRYALEPIMKQQKISYEYKSVKKRRASATNDRALKQGGLWVRSGGIL